MADIRSGDPERRRFARRTRSRLALGGIAAAATVTLSGCDGGTPDFKDAQFTSVSECVKGGFPENLCQSSYSSALQEYQKGAPQFSNLQKCEQEWGTQQCAQYGGSGPSYGNSGSNVFVPLLAGFVISQALQRRYDRDGGAGLGYYGGYGGGYRGSPIYRDRNGGTVVVDRSGGRTIAKPVNVNTTTVARSGFGGMGKSRGGYSFGG
jgi:uncharacterized protein YgiB involved in biofilm formation